MHKKKHALLGIGDLLVEHSTFGLEQPLPLLFASQLSPALDKGVC